MTQITLNLQAVRERIALAAKSYGRDPDHIRLLAVSKKQPPGAIVEASDAGQRHFGENYVQEALAKQGQTGRPLCWHFIGHIQKNKTRDIAAHFDWVHTVDRANIARRLDSQRDPSRPLNVLIQVNLSDDPGRAGILPDALGELAHDVAALERLRLRGLMTLPPVETEFGRQRMHFRRLALLAEDCRRQGLAMGDLSMGMSGDLEAAVAEGATWLRVGTALFGHRPDGRYSNASPRD